VKVGVRTLPPTWYSLFAAEMSFSLSGLCPCGASAGGRGFGHIIILGVCVKAEDRAVLTGREANGRNPMALLGQEGAQKDYYYYIITLCSQCMHAHTHGCTTHGCMHHGLYMVVSVVFGVAALASRWGYCGAILISYLSFMLWQLLLSTQHLWSQCQSTVVPPAAAASLVSNSSLSCQCSCTGASCTGWTGFGTHPAVSFIGRVSPSSTHACLGPTIGMHLLWLFGVSLSRGFGCCWLNGCLVVVGG